MTIAACPACSAAAPVARERAHEAGVPTHQLYLPGMHCAGCIRTVEDVLNAQPDIDSARVNLTLRRAAITANPGTDPARWIDALAKAGYEAHEIAGLAAPADESRALIVRLGVAGFAMMNVMLLSVAVWAGATDATRDMFHWISAAIALPAALFSAQPFFANAMNALRAGRLNMDVPISLAILLASALSLWETARGGEHAYFDAALSLTFFLLAGRVLEARMRRAARSAAADLAALEPARAMRFVGESRESVPVDDIGVGDTLWLTAGARLPVDGQLLSDRAEIDRSALTGESDPVRRVRGARLRAGEVTLDGPVTVQATAVGAQTTLRRMAQLVSVAENARSRYSGLADRAARIYAPAVHLIAFAGFVGWMLATGDLRLAANIAVATLIITCPCALGLAVPAVATAATGRLFRRGLLVKSETALERLAEIDHVVFDKTGTLTRATLHVPEGLDDAARGVLRALAEASDHPLARSLAPQLAQTPPAVLSDLSEVAGTGVHARWNGLDVFFGRRDAETVLAIGDAVHVLTRGETLLPGAPEAVRALRDQGLEVEVLTGDTPARASDLAQTLGLKQVEAGLSPQDKAARVTALQAAGHRVLMVGDGLNDTAALAAAHASIAPGSALEASRNAADVVLLSGDLQQIAPTLTAAASARRRILQNFGLAAIYNAVAIPLALAGLATPLMAALAMSASSVTVILNALRER